MKIAIDASCLIINPNSGLAEVVRNLITELPLVEDGNEFTLFFNYFKTEKNLKNNQFPGTIYRILRVPRRLVNLSWKLRFQYMDSVLPETEIYHSLHIQIPPSNRMKKLLTVHDCRFLAFPGLYHPKVVEDYRHQMSKSLERSEMVVTVSNYTRQELLTHFKISEDRIKVIHNGFQSNISSSTNKKVNKHACPKRIILPNDFLLFVGMLDPRKNLKRLIQAMFLLKKEVGDIPSLVITGISQLQWCKSDEAKLADRLNMLKDIHVVGVVEKDILYSIIKRSLALCYPSIYEGFGFPPLEAMSQGIPVLAGMNSSIPEITGDAACLVDIFNVNDIANGLQRIIFHEHDRQQFVKQGFKQIKKFSWRRAANEYIRLYKQVLA